MFRWRRIYIHKGKLSIINVLINRNHELLAQSSRILDKAQSYELVDDLIQISQLQISTHIGMKN